MGLSYTTTKQVTEKRDLVVPSSWSMYTNRGNKRMTEIAQEAADRIAKLDEEAKYQPKRKEVVSELERMYKKYKRLWNTKTYPESGDTAVREAIRHFGEKMVFCLGYGRFDSRDIEENAYRNA